MDPILSLLTLLAESLLIWAVLNPGKAKHEPKSAENTAIIIMRPSFEVRSRPTVISSKPTSNIVEGIDRDAKHKTKLIEPNMTRTDRSPAFALPKKTLK